MHDSLIARRRFCAATTAALAGGFLQRPSFCAESKEFRLKYILGSCMYGYQYVGEIFPEVRKTNAAVLCRHLAAAACDFRDTRQGALPGGERHDGPARLASQCFS